MTTFAAASYRISLFTERQLCRQTKSQIFESDRKLNTMSRSTPALENHTR